MNQQPKTREDSDDDDYALEKPRLLIVDDSPTMCRAMSRLLADDFRVVEANDGEAAWDIISSDTTIQTVFTDLMMPEMNGFQLLRLIRESVHPRINQLPVVIVTGHGDDERMRRQAMRLGATDFITKPFDSLQLRARARSAAHLDQTTRKLQQATKALELESTIDPLTGLANRHYLMKHGPEMLSYAIRHATPISLLRISVDQYDALERSKGAALAEKVLNNIARLISSSVRPEDTTARIGRAEFAVLMLGTLPGAARQAGLRIHQLMRKTGYRTGSAHFHMTVSEGLVSPALTATLRFDEVLKVAESRLGKAMREGGDKIVFAAAEGKTAKSAPPADALTLDEALVLLRAGQLDKLRPQVRRLLARVFPLLVYGNREMGLEFEPCLRTLRDHLKAPARKS
ncbi:response regulator [Acidihalobacter ferrooxydans]|uniref:Diguanylate cyclase response regulator n=1 Tax=Acidihalobacter ferrooxydans TaxID=1765967 RepID=A0A1P8UCX8_9GAMM|nr:response regulator [Acidihalobacter ferrooxydans]APZ41711.1 diguanylate cyclase response regulator [Acidihalobacter ferrooxydans]